MGWLIDEYLKKEVISFLYHIKNANCYLFMKKQRDKCTLSPCIIIISRLLLNVKKMNKSDVVGKKLFLSIRNKASIHVANRVAIFPEKYSSVAFFFQNIAENHNFQTEIKKFPQYFDKMEFFLVNL